MCTHVWHCDGHDEYLSRGQPERPLARKVLRDDPDEALQTPEDRAVDHDGARRRAARVGSGCFVRGAVLEVEALGELEVELDGRALERAAEGVPNLDVDLGAVERAVARVQFPLARVELVQRLRQLLEEEGWRSAMYVHVREGIKEDEEKETKTYCLGLVPGLDVPKVVLRAGGKLEGELEAEEAIDVLHEIEERRDLLLDLRGHAEDVRVVLHEATDAREAGECARRLVPVEDAELSHTDGQLLVRAVARVENEAVAGAVHRLQSPLLLLDVEREHVVLVVLPVAGRLPQFRVVHVRRDNYDAR